MLFTALPLHATVTLNIQFGVARDSLGVAVEDGTLWALIVDTNNDSSFTGFGLDSRLANTTTADGYFTPNQELSVGGTIGGDTIFAMGAFNGTANAEITGLALSTLALTLGQNGLTAGRNFAFYWFPGATYSGAESPSIVGSQVGGINSSVVDTGASLDALVIPVDGTSLNPGVGTSEVTGGTVSSDFHAVNLTAIPEPSSALLAVFGSLLLFRRRRSS